MGVSVNKLHVVSFVFHFKLHITQFSLTGHPLNVFKMSKLLTVFGATGNQGGSVVRAVLNDPALLKEFKIRGITRDVSKPAAQALVNQGVEVKVVGAQRVFYSMRYD